MDLLSYSNIPVTLPPYILTNAQARLSALLRFLDVVQMHKVKKMAAMMKLRV